MSEDAREVYLLALISIILALGILVWFGVNQNKIADAINLNPSREAKMAEAQAKRTNQNTLALIGFSEIKLRQYAQREDDRPRYVFPVMKSPRRVK